MRKRVFICMILVLFINVSICLAGDEWIKKKDMPTPRYGMSASTVDGKIYLIGGFDNRISSIVEEYDPKTEIWTRKTDMPTPRACLCAGVVNGKVYAIGGYNGDGHGMGLSTVEEYDPKLDKWTKKSDMPTPRWLFSTSVIDGKIYALGGFSNDYIAVVEEYNPLNDEWIKKRDLLARRSSFSSYSVNGKIYVMGGAINAGGGVVVDAKDVEKYDPKANKWQVVTKMPTERFDLCTSVVNGKIYAIGGGVDKWVNNASSSKGVNTVEAYDPEKNEWTTKASMPTARYYFAQEVVDGNIYTFGGVSSSAFTLLANVEEYIPESSFSVSSKESLITSWGKIKQK